MNKIKRNSREKTENRLRQAFERIKVEGRPTGPTAFSREVGIDRTYLYSFTSLATEIADYGRQMQPGISSRGAGSAKTRQVSNNQLEIKKNKEYQAWSKEIPKLREQIEIDQKRIAELEESKLELQAKMAILSRVYESVIFMAVENGVSPIEIERIQSMLKNGNKG